MSVRNASSSIYYGNIDAQKWSLVSVNTRAAAEQDVAAKLAEEEDVAEETAAEQRMWCS